MWKKLRSFWDAADEREDWKKLISRLESVEAELKRLTDSKPEVRIHVERLDVQRAALENLTFRLDKLEIDELSGALNLGNNFGAAVGQALADSGASAAQTKQRPPMPPETVSRSAPGTAGSSTERWETTATGYSCKFGEKANGRHTQPKT